MITFEELNPHNYTLTPQQEDNLKELHRVLNLLRTFYAKPMIITSGLRSKEDQERINPTKKNSAHLAGAAADISDPRGDLWSFLLDNVVFRKNNKLYLEDRSYTPRWVHAQITPPLSRNLIFLP